jgi:serine/threonine-protein kinase
MVSLECGRVLERYRVLANIGNGGMGSVYAALQMGSHNFTRLVALKVVRADLARDADFRSMFLDEVRIASAIDHPNVVRVIDLGEEGGLLYAAMDYVDGQSVQDLVRAVERKGEELPVGIAVRLVADACAGLHAAHELKDVRGESLDVVHRDVSPHNLLVDGNGIVRVIDFGIAKARQRLSRETTSAMLKGKARYMAPEQATGESVDRRVDVFALGVVAYRLLSGKLPFDGDHDLAVLHKLLQRGPVAPLPSRVPRPLADVVMRMLAFAPDERPSTAEVARVALERAMTESHITSSTAEVSAYVRAHFFDATVARRALLDAAVRNVLERPQQSLGVLCVPTPAAAFDVGEFGSAPKVARADSAPARRTHVGLGPADGSVPPPTTGESGAPLTGEDAGTSNTKQTFSRAARLSRRPSAPGEPRSARPMSPWAVAAVFGGIALGAFSAIYAKRDAHDTTRAMSQVDGLTSHGSTSAATARLGDRAGPTEHIDHPQNSGSMPEPSEVRTPAPTAFPVADAPPTRTVDAGAATKIKMDKPPPVSAKRPNAAAGATATTRDDDVLGVVHDRR